MEELQKENEGLRERLERSETHENDLETKAQIMQDQNAALREVVMKLEQIPI